MILWSRREWLQKAGMGTAVLTLGPSALVGKLFAEEPHLSVSPLNKLSDADEIQLGRRFAAQLESEEQIISNVLIDYYQNGLVLKLASQSQRPNLPYSIKLVNSHVPNASSVPGGFLYVNRGLIELIDTENELVATLAHEVGHVAGRHVVNKLTTALAARSMLKPVRDNLNEQNGVIEKIISQFGGAVAMLAMMHFSREDENEADLLGFYEMLRAGWDPHGFLELFARFDELEKVSGRAPVPFLSSHPPTQARIAAIRRELAQVKVPADAATDSMKFQLFKSAMAILPPPPEVPQRPHE